MFSSLHDDYIRRSPQQSVYGPKCLYGAYYNGNRLPGSTEVTVADMRTEWSPKQVKDRQTITDTKNAISSLPKQRERDKHTNQFHCKTMQPA